MKYECKTHGIWNADIASGCPECVRDMRSQLAAKEAELEQVKRERDGWKVRCDEEHEFLQTALRDLSIERKRADDNEKALENTCERLAEINRTIATNPLTAQAYAMVAGEARLTKEAWLNHIRNEVRKAQEG
jgi:hypothetical protein